MYTAVQDRHLHLYSIVYNNEDHIWCPQEKHGNKNFLANIPIASGLDHYSEYFTSPFHTLVFHTVPICPKDHTLPDVTICAKVGLHPCSLLWPFGYLESNFLDSIKSIFNSFPPFWLEYFEGAHVPIVGYDFLDRCLVTLAGYLHFDREGIFIVGRHSIVEDALKADPLLAHFCTDVQKPVQPFLYLMLPPGNLPL
jgi:hypothetical protein